MNRTPPSAATAPDSPTLRAFAALELIGRSTRALSLAELVRLLRLPKPTVHRMLSHLAAAGLVIREPGAGYSVGPRLARLGRDLVVSDAGRPVRRAILQRLVETIGETCNFTMLEGSEVVYLDRVETAWPLRVNLQPGSRVPVHCSASGKMLLAHLDPDQAKRLIDLLPMRRHTSRTITDRAALRAELARTREQGYSVDDEEYLDGLVCAAVPVSDERGRVWAAVAVQGPASRMPLAGALRHLPALRRAAAALARSYADPPRAPIASAGAVAANPMR